MHLLRKISQSKYFQQVFTLSTGTVGAQLITLLAYIIIARLYDQDDFGLFKLFESISILIAFISTLAFEHAIVLPAKRKSALVIFKLSTLFLLITNIIVILSILLFGNLISHQTNLETSLLLLLPISSTTIGLINIFGNWYIQRNDYKNLSIGKLAQSLITSASQIIIGFSKSISSGLIIGYISGRVFSSLFYFFKSSISVKEYYSIKRKRIIVFFNKYIEQPKFVLPSKLIQQFSNEIPVFLTVIYFNDTLLGFLALSMKGLSTPTQFIGISVGQVFYKQLADRFNNKQKVQSFVIKTWLGLFSIGLIPFGSLMIWGPEIFSFVFGSDWSMTGKIASILSPAIFIYFIIGPTERAIFLVFNKQKFILYFSLLDFILKIIAFVVGSLNNDFLMVIKLMSIFQIVTLVLISINLYMTTVKVNYSESS